MTGLEPQQHTDYPGRNVLLRSIFIQIAVLLLLAAGALSSDGVWMYSAFFGATVVALPYCWSALRAYLSWGMAAGVAKKTRRLYGGEVQKLLMTAVLSSVVFIKVQPLNAGGFFVAFVVVMLLGWLVPAWLLHKQNRA